MNTWITTSSLYQHSLTEDEAVLLDQVVDIDGEDAVVIERRPVKNASNRVIGDELVITDEAWEFVQESIRQAASW